MSLSSTPPTPAATPWDNPMGTDGFEFIEYAAPDPAGHGRAVRAHGLQSHREAPPQGVTLYRQGGINFILNAEPDSFAQRFARLHGPSDLRHRVPGAGRQGSLRARVGPGRVGLCGQAGPGELNIPAIKGIGDSIIYFIDRWRGKNGAKDGDIGNIGFFDVDFEPLPGAELNRPGYGMTVHRPPDPQRAPRPHGRVGRLLRAAVQFPRGALLRH
jgi:4-hydroxyphenylpyruvate dioxygenase